MEGHDESVESCKSQMVAVDQRFDLFSDESSENSNSADKANNGTQTKFMRRRSKGQLIPSVLFRKSLSKTIKQIIPSEKPAKRKVKLMDWKRFHKLNVIYSFMDELEKDFPAICTVSVIGKSVQGRDIKMLKISNSEAGNPAVWLDAAIHSREWISTAVVTYLADYIVRNFQKLSESITNKDWYIVPVLNPDGYVYTHTSDRMWRKNRAKQDGKRVGVDLNRNFSYRWGNNDEEGSSDSPNHVFYRGPAPFSEPETCAVRDTILSSQTPYKVFLSFHSYYELILFPWGFKAEPCQDYLQLLEGGAVMARAIYESSGMLYKVGSTKDLTYFACGTSIDWSYGIAKIPYSYMIELRSRKHRFKLPKDQILDTCEEIWQAVKSLMEFVDQPRTKKL
ncbi:carboxypeptidase B-like isoform X1 [Maniola jurtina]|uniref:carboxypeptidase B-like isoform X1 n=1 Tax=Maniola jurtina TaxID=191418 RepID=UPI001E68C4AC|nr:carboxypeptidase B-like isoform X1 [Maniola jurtina]